ncbi:hypothetical protein RUM44_004123 [Polyplax serrata]|uniref:Uncharacterized protein n=1 Tax=Polyplax serrata TaxID=468196 RepID=A0ABR1B1X5_POLSC
MDIDMEVKTVRMMVKKVFNSNKILTEATNLFLKQNGQEVLKAMTPQLRKKLASIFMKIGNHVFDNVPLNMLYQRV